MESGKTFFSYSRDDSDFVKKLADDLRANGVDIWLDQDDIPVGKNWDEEIQKALVGAQNQLIVLTPSAVSSPNVMNEIMVAVTKKKNIIPIKLKECETPLQIARLQWIDFTTDYNKGFNHLLKALALGETAEITKHPLEGQKQEAGQTSGKPSINETKINPSQDKSISSNVGGVKKNPLKLILAVAAIIIIVVVAIIALSSSGSDKEEFADKENQPVQENYSTQDNNSELNNSEYSYATLESPEEIKVCTGIDQEGNAVGITNEFYVGEEVFVWANVLAYEKEDVRFEWIDNARSIFNGQVWSVDDKRSLITDSHTFNEPGSCEVILYNSEDKEIGSLTFTVEEFQE